MDRAPGSAERKRRWQRSSISRSAVRRGGIGSADQLCERGQSVAGPGQRARPGDRGSPGSGSAKNAPHPPIPGREFVAFRAGRHRGFRDFIFQQEIPAAIGSGEPPASERHIDQLGSAAVRARRLGGSQNFIWTCSRVDDEPLRREWHAASGRTRLQRLTRTFARTPDSGRQRIGALPGVDGRRRPAAAQLLGAIHGAARFQS